MSSSTRRTHAENALEAISGAVLADSLGELVRIPSLTGQEEDALRHVATVAGAWGLEADLREYDLDQLRVAEGYPGETAARSDLFGVTVALKGTDPAAPRLCVNAHVDVVPAGDGSWLESPWSGSVRSGSVYGRGAVDMKGGLIASLHALAATAGSGWRPRGDIVIQVVSSEEDGGLGTFAGLTDDDNFAAALIPEPTGMRVVCAHAGSQHFRGSIEGRAAHAALRLDGRSAIDRYLPVHEAIRSHEKVINSEVRHPLLRELALPCPIEVGRLEAGSWSAEVPDLLRFSGRVGYPIGVTAESARSRFERCLDEAVDDTGPLVKLEWPAGFAPGETPGDDPFVTFLSDCLAEERGSSAPPPEAVPWGADMHQYTSRGIPCAMFGPTGIERAHAPDEAVEIADLVELARIFVRVYMGFGEQGVR